MYGERGDVGRSNDAPDGKRGAKLIAAVFEFIAEKLCRQRCLDKASGDQVHADGRELERKTGGQRRHRGVTADTIPSPRPTRLPAVPPMNSSVPPGLTLGAALRATQSASNMCSLIARRGCSNSISRRGQ